MRNAKLPYPAKFVDDRDMIEADVFCVRSSRRRAGTSETARPHDITLVIDSMSGGGAQRVMLNLIKIWSRQGLRICLVTSSGEDTDKISLPADITRISLRNSTRFAAKRNHLSTFRETVPQPIRQHIPWKSAIGKLLNAIGDVRALTRVLSMTESPVVLAFMTPNNVKTIIASVGLDVRVIVAERIDTDKQQRNWPWHVLRRWLYRYADAVTANSHGALKSMETYVPKSKLFFVPNQVSFPTAAARHPHRQKMILNVGRLTHQKAQDILLKADARVASALPEWKLVIVGHGHDKDELHTLSSSLGLSGRVAWINWATKNRERLRKGPNIRPAVPVRGDAERTSRCHELWSAVHRHRQIAYTSGAHPGRRERSGRTCRQRGPTSRRDPETHHMPRSARPHGRLGPQTN